MQTPVVHGCAHRKAGTLSSVWLNTQGRSIPVGVIGHRLGNRPEHKPGTHTSCEQHGKPGQQRELWLGIKPANPNLAHRHENKGQTENNKQVCAEKKAPVEHSDRTILGAIEQLLCTCGENKCSDNEGNNQDCG